MTKSNIVEMIGTIFAVLTGLGLAFAILLLGPLIVLASINTLAEQATVDLYIPHNIWTYLSVYGILIVMNAKVRTD